ncbi:hypothetical protein Ancab_000851 [Ancistrocladus abbreviatus]
MVLIDAAFIIELFLRALDPQLREENDQIFQGPTFMDEVIVTYLHKAGVKIVQAEESSLLDITFHEGVLRIPKIDLLDSTESLWRNLVVFEQHHYIEDSYIIDYMILPDLLIDNPMDVEILIENDIVTNWLGNNEDVSNLFRNLAE